MRVPESLCRVLLAVALVAFLIAPAAFAEEEGGDEEAEPAEEVEELSPEEARRLAALLKRAAGRRKVTEVFPVLDEVGERSHPSFHKPLLKMLTHQSSRVAVRAADMLMAQELESEKGKKKLGKAMWKKGFTDRKNHRRYLVQARIILATAVVEGGVKLDDKRGKETERLWRAVIGDPHEANAPALISVCEYVRLTKDKRLCRVLSEEIDQPMATAVNSPTNPPQEWWERRWKLWKPVMAEVVETLEELTGQSFKDTESAKAWFRANEKEFGFRW